MKKADFTILSLIKSEATCEHRKLGYFLCSKIEERIYRAFDYFESEIFIKESLSLRIGPFNITISNKEIYDNNLLWILINLNIKKWGDLEKKKWSEIIDELAQRE